MKSFILNLQFIFKPAYWIMNYPYSKEVDNLMNYLLDKYDFSNLSKNECIAKLGNYNVWVANIPFASMIFYESELKYLENHRPSRLTIKRAVKKFEAFIIGEREKQIKKLLHKYEPR